MIRIAALFHPLLLATFPLRWLADAMLDRLGAMRESG